MTKLSELYKAKDVAKATFESTVAEIDAKIQSIQSACPHPNSLLDVDVDHYDDGGPGVPRYDYSIMKVSCGLCDKTAWSDHYNAERSSNPDPQALLQKVK